MATAVAKRWSCVHGHLWVSLRRKEVKEVKDIDERLVEYGGKLYSRTIVRGYSMLREVVDGKVDDSKGIMEHRLVYELSHGVKLPKDVQVHHLNRNRCDNRPDNLIALSREDHMRLHAYEDAVPELAAVEPVTVISGRKAVQEFAKRVVVHGGKPYYRTCGRDGAILYPIDEDGVHSDRRVPEHRLVYELANNVILMPGTWVRHINGDVLDNRPDNLHMTHGKAREESVVSLEGSYSVQRRCVDCGKPIDTNSTRCRKCENARRGRHVTDKITKEELERLIEDHTNLEIARMFGASESAVRQWRAGFNLPSASEMAKKRRNNLGSPDNDVRRES